MAGQEANELYGDLDEILVTEEAIRERVAEIGEAISDLYGPGADLTVISIINGAILFTADLIREIHITVRLDCVRVSSYRDSSFPEGPPEIIDTLRLPVEGREVLLIDDILDTGRTLEQVTAKIQALNPASLRTCVLLEKIGRRETETAPNFVGFEIPDKFAVGYGLDFAERYRNLPCIGTLRPELQNPPEWA